RRSPGLGRRRARQDPAPARNPRRRARPRKLFVVPRRLRPASNRRLVETVRRIASMRAFLTSPRSQFDSRHRRLLGSDIGRRPTMLRIDVLLTENELAEQCLAALRNRYLPEKLFYWFPLSVRAWLNLCKSAAPYRNFSRSYELIQKHAVEIARQLTGPSAKQLEVVGLGDGQ